MAENQTEGFLTGLGLGQINEQAVMDRALGRDNPNRDPNDRNTMIREGMQQGGLAVRALENARRYKKDNGGKLDYDAAQKRVRDEIVEKTVGLRPGELASRRKIRDEFRQQDFGDMTNYDNRIAAAQFVARRAAEEGNTPALDASLAQLSALVEEKQEYQKEQAGIESTEEVTAGRKADRVEQMSATGYEVVGEDEYRAVGGTRDMIRDDDGNYRAGMRTSTGFRRFNENFLPTDPRAVSGAGQNSLGLDQRLRLAVGGKYIAETKDLLQANFKNMAQSYRLMKDIRRWGDDAVSIIGGAGEVTAEVNSAVNNLTGIVRMLGGGSEADWEAGGEWKDEDGNWQRRRSKEEWHKMATDDSNPIWNVLPDNFRGNAREATLFRAHIMDLAYMAARLAEPSNRGLSDRDIESALIRIAGSLNDPKALSHRIAEMAAEGMMDVEARMKGLRGTVRDYKGWKQERIDDEVIQLAGGEAYPALQAHFGRILDDFELEADYDTYTVRARDTGEVSNTGDDTGVLQPGAANSQGSGTDGAANLQGSGTDADPYIIR